MEPTAVSPLTWYYRSEGLCSTSAASTVTLKASLLPVFLRMLKPVTAHAFCYGSAQEIVIALEVVATSKGVGNLLGTKHA